MTVGGCHATRAGAGHLIPLGGHLIPLGTPHVFCRLLIDWLAYGSRRLLGRGESRRLGPLLDWRG